MSRWPANQEDRIWPNVRQVDSRLPCGGWEWTGGTNPAGYGQICFDGRQQPAHRVVYQLVRGLIPEGMALDHECHDPMTCLVPFKECPHHRCVDPSHVVPKPNADNARRMRKHGSKPTTHCPAGHEYTAAITRVVQRAVAAHGGKCCLVCHRIRMRRIGAVPRKLP